MNVEKFTEQEKAVITKICGYFSEDALKHAAVVFTHGDQLPEGKTIEDFVRQSKLVSDLVEKCGGRCLVIDNKYWSKTTEDVHRSNQFQVEQLLNTIDKIVTENKGSCYTNEMLQEVKIEIELEEANIRQSSGNMSDDEIKQQAKDRVFEKLLIRLAGTATGVLLGAFFGVVVMVGLITTVLRERPTPVQLREATVNTLKAVGGGLLEKVGGPIGPAVATMTICGAAGAMKGGFTGYDAAEGAKTPQEAVQMATLAVKKQAQSVLNKGHDVRNRLLQPESTSLEEAESLISKEK